MPKLKKGSKSKYTTIDNYCFMDKTLSYKELGLLCNMLSLPDDWDFNIRGLAALHKDCYESVANTVNLLIEKGYVYREQPNNREAKGHFGEIVYWIYENPEDNPRFIEDEPRSGKPITVNPITVKPITDIPITEKSSQLNTKELNPKNIKESGSILDSFSEEEIMQWNDEEFYSHLSDSQYKAFCRLLKDCAKGEIHSSKESLINYFKKMIAREWKDSSGKSIKNICGYVKMNFQIKSGKD